MNTTTITQSDKASLAWQALLDSLPIFAAYFPLGIVWGVLWEQAGLPPVWGILFSIGVYAGAVQFLALSFLALGAPIWTLLLTIIPVALRNSFYTVAVLDRLPKYWLWRLFATFGLVDATFAVLVNQPNEKSQDPWYTIPLTAIVQSYWVLGTAIGIWAGTYVPNQFESLDFALPSLIAVLAIEQKRKIGSWKPVILALLSALTAWSAIGHNWLLPAIVLCSLTIVLWPQKEISS